MAPFILSFLRHLLRYCTFWIFVLLPASLGNNWNQRVVTREDLKSTIDVFSQPNVMSYSQLLFDIERYQLIVGSRDYLFRLTLEGLQKLEEAHWPADEDNIRTCLLKGKSEDDCRNYIKVLVNYNGKLFSCGTNGFLPECSWREINSLRSIKEWIKGTDLCPYSPHANSTALMTSQGDYYVASTIDFTGQNPVILKIMGKQPYLKTVQFDPKWLSNPSFIGAFEIDNFIYFFFREAAVEYINCGKATYSRIARVCKNDQGGQFFMKDKFTTFLKSRLNCSVPGNYPFYYNEIQSVYFLEKEEIFYATFTTSDNSIYGSAVCAYNMTSIQNSFNGAFKHQGTPKNAWERKLSPLRHFQCETPSNTDHYLDAQKYQLMNEAVQPLSPQPLFSLELQRLSHIVVDVVQTKTSDDVHVMFVATNEGLISKLVIVPNSKETCVIENIKIFDDKSRVKIMAMKLLKDTASLYIGTEESVLRLPVQRCDRFKTKGECLGAMDPYCGWNEYQLSCTSAPNRNPRTLFWHQQEITCAKSDVPIDGRWSSWSQWEECSHIGAEATGDRCMCQQRSCDNPQPSNGGRACKGANLHVTNCTRNGQWTDWSAWSSCSATCGLALKSRVRSCGNPSPAYGGRICIGPEKDEIYCTSNPPCPASVLVPIDGHWSEWSTWEECTSSCGGGTQVRRRRCNSPPPQYGGRECHGCDQDFRICNLDVCSEKRKSTGWTPFFRVNQTKEGHFEQRFRFSCRANVPDENMLRVGQMRKEERFCREGTHSCLDATFLNVDGNWSSWSLWSQCSSSCGGGVQFRERHCNDPKPLGLGADCVGLARMDRVCNVEACEDLDMWEEWTVWSPCDDNQEQHRRRNCRFSMSGAVYCKGSTRETRMCVPRQLSASSSSKDSAPEDGIHAEHVVGAFISGLIVGGLLAALGLYFYTKRVRGTERTVERSHVNATQLIPFKTNTYVDGNEWKNNSVDKELQQKVPLREATIKRNGNFRAQIQSDHNF